MADPTPTDQNPPQKDNQLTKLSENANKLKAQASSTLGAIIKNPIGNKINKATILIVSIMAYLALKWFNYLMDKKSEFTKGTPYLMSGLHHGLNPMVVNTSNPERDNFIELPRSTNEDHGEEFSFSFWMNIADMNHKQGKWKHVFHRGNRSNAGIAAPGRAPAVYIHENTNSLRIYMNTSKEAFDYTDIHNIPIKKWFHVAIILRGRYLDVYLNGRLKNRHVLNSLPKQNYGDLYVTHDQGFNGFLTGLRYFSYALTFPSLQDIINGGPGQEGENSCLADTSENSPPYLDSDWWKTRYSSPTN